jgi:hypothetical protein
MRCRGDIGVPANCRTNECDTSPGNAQSIFGGEAKSNDGPLDRFSQAFAGHSFQAKFFASLAAVR